jgi:hypothetical protein
MSTKERVRSALKDWMVRSELEPRASDFDTFAPEDRAALAREAATIKRLWSDGDEQAAFAAIDEAVAKLADVRTLDPVNTVDETDPRELARGIQL